jgi:hypothetical protein
MRLLDTTTFELCEFFDRKIPPYAILSHTWGEGEVSFQELQSGDGVFKRGYAKIRTCCELAASDGFEYAWVDTCCIDKTSSAELSEAINSMYRWYRFSDVCYVFLADVPANLGESDVQQALCKSKWFTRGWTLQELIASPSVMFFDSRWGELGTKDSLGSLITEITQVSREVLQDANQMERFSVAQKMSWASRRVTTRVEDIAYCLLGIFGVNMPLLYGEGEHAFIRLQEEIMKNTTDHTIFAWTSDLYSFNDVPGLLALTPAHFSKSGKYVQSEGFTVNPFSVTNKGIHLQLPIMDLSSKSLAILACHEIGNESKNLGIFVERLSRNGDVFKKVWCEKLGMANKARVPHFEQENIFVKQNRVSPDVPVYSTYRVAIKSLRRAGFILGQSAPEGWSRLGDDYLKPPDSLFYNELFGVLQFWESESSHDSRRGGFLVILKFGWSKAGSGEESSVMVMEHIPNIFNDVFPISSSWPQDEKVGQLLLILNGAYGRATKEQVWALLDAQSTSPTTGRIYWQHPIRKWRISVIIKRGIFEGERRRIIHIDYHNPEEGDISKG